MPRCCSCSKNYDDPSVMELSRQKNNRWVAVCRHCLDMGIDVNQLEPSVAVESQALSMADSPWVEVTPSGDPLNDAKQLLESLRNLRRSKERVGRPRSHERRKIELTVYFSLARDDTRHEGTVKDFSQGGLRVLTNYPLTKGQVVRFDWNIPLPPAMARMLQGTGEVRRAFRDDSGNSDVGFKFLSRAVDKGANRRRFRRYRCEMLVFYQRVGSEVMSCGRVVDISQGGCQLYLDEALRGGEVFWVRMIGGGGTKGDLVGNMRVCRVIPRNSEFETGCAFEKMRMEKQAT